MRERWKAETLANLRRIIMAADPTIFEAVKWKMPSRPEGLAVWMSDGNVCYAEILKDNKVQEMGEIFIKGENIVIIATD